jgi:hypothetical protein
MTGMTEAQKQALLTEYINAEKAILRGQAYTIKDRSLTRADLRWVQEGRKKLEEELAALAGNGAIKPRRVIFRDD